MAREIEYIPLDEIALDPFNPRLGRAAHQLNLNQDQIYDRMKDWSLEELATSFLESGFWPHEAVLCVIEPIQGQDRLVVIEGNRRIEVKASLSDPRMFEMGESEVRTAKAAARPRSGQRYAIAYVSNVGEPSLTRVEMLPNPMSEEGEALLRILGEGIRYGFSPRR